MVNVPSRDELYTRIDQEFHQQYPDAPGQLSASDPAHADWRKKWIEIRDFRLNDECNRVYWAENPDAPTEIDPKNPDHERYQKSWLEIRDQIMSNSPDAPNELAFVDLSYIRYGVNNWFVAIDSHLRHLRSEVESWLNDAVTEIEKAYHDGRIVHGEHEYWTGTPRVFPTGRTAPSVENITLTPKASFEPDGVLWGGVDADPAPVMWALSLTDPE
jgi:hypothetical protein